MKITLTANGVSADAQMKNTATEKFNHSMVTFWDGKTADGSIVFMMIKKEIKKP